MRDFFQMGGYAPFVWGSYAVAALMLVGLGLAAWRRLAAQRRLVAELERARPPRRRARSRGAGAGKATDTPHPPGTNREHALDDA
ncbi:MAG: heme exporter protein CcmD [Azospirillaceae bacterium]